MTPRKRRLLILSAALTIVLIRASACAKKEASPPPLVSRGYTVPLIDLAADSARQVVVDREPGQYLGHPTTVLLEDGRTMITVYPKGHGRGPIVMKRSEDGGLTWSDRLPVPENWATSLEMPTIHRVVGKDGTKRLIVWSGLYPARLAVSEDDGVTWTPLEPAGDWGGIVVMSALVELKPFGSGHYMAMFHDDGRFFGREPHQEDPVAFTLYKTLSEDGGLTWSDPEAIFKASEVHLCEPGVIRSPDGRTLAALLRENSRTRNSFVIFSKDEGVTWSEPRELPGALTGDRHTGRYAPDGRLLVSFRDMTHDSPTRGGLGGLGRHLRRHRQRARGAVPRPADGQHQGQRLRLSRRRGPAGRHVRPDDLRPLDGGGAAVHHERPPHACRARPPK